MACKDCIHGELCSVMDRFGVVDLPYDEYGICDFYKSKDDVVEVKRGHWIKHRIGRRTEIWSCSECTTMGSPSWKCCPVCTTFMDGKDDTE